jgi:hypothetical protein
MPTETLSNPPIQTETEKWIEADAADFAAKFDRKSFEIRHHLETHPLFQMPKLMELAERTLKNRPEGIYYDAGEIKVDQRWDAVQKTNFSAMEAMERVETCGAWFIFRSAQQDPEYRPILDHSLGELKRFMGLGINNEIMVEDIIIFVTSPNRVTSYHIDRECNFLLQIKGTKTMWVFDREDRDVLPEAEIEKFWTVDNNAPVYKPHLQERATAYHMTPGMGVHIPVNCPHWLKNDNNVSVSLSVNFQFKDSIRANAYRANYWLRKLGITPTPPGQSAALDSLKAQAVKPVIWAQSAFRKVR